MPRTALCLVAAVIVAIAPASKASAPGLQPASLPSAQPSAQPAAVPPAAVPQVVVSVRTPASVLAAMTLPQRVGQLFMVGTPAGSISTATVRALQLDHVGSVILTGRSSAGVAATAALTARLRSLATTRVGYLVGTDQEGGLVQVLRGPGFSAMPTALTQGSWSVALVRSSARHWGGQLAAAGVDVDLAPVLDTVPGPAAAAGNPPIGQFRREYGFTPAQVSAKGGAFAAGLAAAGVDATVKHFPGLGRVTANTDVTAGVTDRVTTRRDPYLAPYADAVKAGAPFVMMSTAIYSRIDPGVPAAFSRTVIATILRGDLGFRGVVVSDDLGNARQVAAWSLGARAVDFVQAGGDLVLTVNPATLPAMYAAVLAKAQTSPAFLAQVNGSALRILTAKAARGLIAGVAPSHLEQDLPDVAARLQQPVRLGGG